MKTRLFLIFIFVFTLNQYIFAYDMKQENLLDKYAQQIANIVFEELEKNEILKAGGLENYNLVKSLYNSDAYKEQQTETIKKIILDDSGSKIKIKESQTSQVRETIKQKIIDFESLKLGGSENYNLVKEYYSSKKYIQEQKNEINDIIKKYKENKGQKTKDTYEIQKITSNKIKSLKEGASFYGPKNAKISIFVFTDFQCPFCKRFHTDKTIQNIQKKYSTKINYTLKYFPLTSLYSYSNSLALATECVKEQQGKTGMNNYIDKIMNTDILKEESIMDIAYRLNVNKENFNNCYSTAKYQEIINKNMNEGINIFGINGTPSSIIINTQTNKWIIIGGAYPQENFEDAINQLLK